MVDYQGNSHRSKEQKGVPEKKKLEKIVTGEVIVKPPGMGKKLKGVFFGGDFKQAGRSVVADVVLPTLRDLVVNAGFRALERSVYPESQQSRRRPEMRSRIQYSSYGQTQTGSAMLPGQAPFAPTPHRIGTRESNSYLIASRIDADNVLTTLVECVSTYGIVSLADLYELLGRPVAAVDNNWGWTNINTAEIRQVNAGFLLELPPMEEIKWV